MLVFYWFLRFKLACTRPTTQLPLWSWVGCVQTFIFSSHSFVYEETLSQHNIISLIKRKPFMTQMPYTIHVLTAFGTFHIALFSRYSFPIETSDVITFQYVSVYIEKVHLTTLTTNRTHSGCH